MQTLLTSPSLLLPLLPNPKNPKPNHLSFRFHSRRPQTLTHGRRRAPPPAAASAAAGRLLSPLAGMELNLNLEVLRPPLAAAMSAAVRWLGVYREVLLVGVLLSWFPNIPWDRQPFSALRDLCDPFLALCREIMPPVFGRKLDLSPLVAFMAIDIIIMILRPQPRM